MANMMSRPHTRPNIINNISACYR